MTEEELSLVRSEMQSALNMFLEHVKYTVTLMSTVSAAGAALIAFCLQQQPDRTMVIVILLLAICCFLLVSILSFLSSRIVRRYYKIYASNYIYSARLHMSGEYRIKHPWIEDLKNTGVTDIDSPNAVRDFMDVKNGDEKHSWRYYRIIIRTFRVIGIVGAVSTIFLGWVLS